MKRVAPHFVMMHGVPGAGKSTLAESLAAAITHRGVKTDLLPEEAIFTRGEFAEVGQGFKSGNWPTSEMMLTAYTRIVEAAHLHNSWVIADWNCVGMIEDLPWAQPDRAALTTFQPDARADMEVLVAHAGAVRSVVAPLIPILLVLNVPDQVAALRAATERGQEWIERYAAPVPEVNTNEPLLDRVVRGYAANLPRNQDMLDAYIEAGWEVVALDASHTRERVLDTAMSILMQKETQV